MAILFFAILSNFNLNFDETVYYLIKFCNKILKIIQDFTKNRFLMKKLNKKQYSFVMARLAGNTLEASYAEAYPMSRKWSRADRDTRACDLMKEPHIKAFYEQEKAKIEAEALEEAKKKAIWSREKSMRVLAFIIQTGVEDINEAKALKKLDPKASQALNSSVANSVIRALAEIDRLIEGDVDPEQKSIARQLIDLNPDDIDERPEDYAVSVKNASRNNNED
jgi:hypothetical protein